MPLTPAAQAKPIFWSSSLYPSFRSRVLEALVRPSVVKMERFFPPVLL